jgi:uncharacterized protein YndB with AHSA1/START domain
MSDYELTLNIDRAPSLVREALAEPKHLAAWLGPDARVGTAGSLIDVQIPGEVSLARFEIASAPQVVRWTCLAGPGGWAGTEAAFGLWLRGTGGTELRFQHRGWQNEAARARAAEYWPGELSLLQAHAHSAAHFARWQ